MKYRDLAVIAISVMGAYTGSAWGQLSDKFNEAKDFGMVESFEIRETIGEVAIQPGEASGGSAEGTHVWAKWTAPKNGLFDLSTIDESSLSVAIYEGSHPAYLRRVLSTTPRGPSILPFDAKEGHTYHFAFAAEAGDEIAVKLTQTSIVNPQPMASNDDFESAVDLGSEHPIVFGSATTDEASLDASERAIGLQADTVWWEWQAPRAGRYLLRQISLINRWRTDEAHAVGLVTASAQEFHDLSNSRFQETMLLEDRERIKIATPAGQQYEIVAADSLSETNPSSNLSTDLGRSEVIETRTLLLLRAKNSSRTFEYTRQLRWTSTFTGVAIVETRWIDQRLPNDAIRVNLRRKAFQTWQVAEDTIQVAVTEGEELVIDLLSHLLDPQGIEFAVRRSSPPENDDFANASQVETGGRVSAVDQLATTEPGEPLHGFGSGKTADHSLWWKWSPETSGSHWFDSNYPFSVYEGSSLETLVEVASGTTYASLEAEQGQVYHIATASDASVRRAVRLGVFQGPNFNNAPLYPAEPEAATDLGNAEFVAFDRSVMADDQETISLRWTAPRDGLANFELNRTESDKFIEFLLYHESSFTYPNRLGTRNIGVREGESYFISLRGFADFEASLTLLPILAPLGNDSFETAEMIDRDLPYEVTWHNHTDPLDVDTSTSQWWRWVAPSTGVYAFQGTYDTTISRGDSLDSLVPIQTQRGENPFAFQAGAGEIFHFRVSNNGPSIYTIRLGESSHGPLSPTLEKAIDLGNETSLRYASTATLMAGQEFGESDLKTAWFTWRAPESGVLRLVSPRHFNLSVGDSDQIEHRKENLYVEQGEQVIIRLVSIWPDTDFEFSLRLHASEPAYALWVQNQTANGTPYSEISNPNEDPDGDGLTNLQEMIFGSSPIRQNQRRQSWESITAPEINSEGYQFDISPAILNGPDPITVLLETSSDLQTWSPTTLEPGSYTMPREADTSQLFYRIQFAE